MRSIHSEMFAALPVALERFIEDPAVGCIVLTGAGSAFCSGGDLDGGEAAADELDTDARIITALVESPKVTIPALPGPAVGAGMAIPLPADRRIAARSARLING